MGQRRLTALLSSDAEMMIAGHSRDLFESMEIVGTQYAIVIYGVHCLLPYSTSNGILISNRKITQRNLATSIAAVPQHLFLLSRLIQPE